MGMLAFSDDVRAKTPEVPKEESISFKNKVRPLSILGKYFSTFIVLFFTLL